MPKNINPNLGFEETWYPKAARLVVREGLNLRMAGEVLEIGLTANEAETIFKSELFQKILWTERQLFYRELANTPGRDKNSAIGLLYYLCQKLIDEGEYDKAVTALEKLMKAEGWTGQEGQVNVFAGLNAKDYAQLMQEVNKEDAKSAGTSPRSPEKGSIN